ncbi:Ubiquitin carboxyl-terminal hydrolase 36 [Halotydeus destructor]|nr:Ubiquitin carboxyl-terminal hydrolase 36 [Halotydeus destructor]
MMDLISGNGLMMESSSGYQSSLIFKNIEFVNAKNSEPSEVSSALKSKYHFLTPEKKEQNGHDSFSSNKTNGSKSFDNEKSSNVSDEIPSSKYVIGPTDKVFLEWRKMTKVGAGLINLGNTCFMNSVLQCLTYCPPLVNYLMYDNDHQKKCKLGFCMTCELTDHAKKAFESSNQAIKPFKIAQRLKSVARHFNLGRQEDAHEYLRYVIDHMSKSCVTAFESLHPHLKLDAASKQTTIINEIFGGFHRSQVQCLQCKATSNTYDYFMDFMLDIKNVSSLEKALEKFIHPEILQQENAYKCSACKKKVPAKKRFTVQRAPKVATFQFKRFDYNRVFGGKITKAISYPEILNLRPYMSENRGPKLMYRLFGVLVHMGGSCNSGHYYCFVRNSNNTWHIMDDARVGSTSLNNVLNQQAYILFYVQMPDPQSISTRKTLVQTEAKKQIVSNGSNYISSQTPSNKNNPSITVNSYSRPSTQSNGTNGLVDKNQNTAAASLKVPASNGLKRTHENESDSSPSEQAKKLKPDSEASPLKKSDEKRELITIKWSDTVKRDLSYKSNSKFKVCLLPQEVKSSTASPENGEPESTLEGFGSKVKSWDGAENSVDQVVKHERELGNRKTIDDLYDEEFDRGKVKKVKQKLVMRQDNYNGPNLFQKQQNYNHSYGSGHSASGNHYHQRKSNHNNRGQNGNGHYGNGRRWNGHGKGSNGRKFNNSHHRPYRR